MGLLRRSEISKELIAELARALGQGESAVVIGPRHSGKSYLTRQVIDSLKSEYSFHTHACSFYTDYPMQSQKEVTDAIRRQIPFIPPSAQTIPDVFRVLKETSSRQGKPLILSLTHFDGVARDIGRQILREIRPAVISQPPSLVVFITGESNIAKLVRGPDSEFTCSHEYLVHGFNVSVFKEFFAKWLANVKLPAELSEENCEYIWKLTHGNTSLFRRFIDSWISGAVSGRLSQKRLIQREEIDAAFDRLVNLGVHGTAMFQWTFELISSEPECWPYLEALIAQDTAETATLEPSTLELAGVAELNGATLRFSSPVMKAFIKKHFGHGSMADLYAQYGQWDEAFRRYALAQPAFPRPASYQDQFIVESITRRLYTTFKSIPLAQLENQLTQGVQGILGFEYVSWWHKNAGSDWAGKTEELSADHCQKISQALTKGEASADDNILEGIVEVEEAGRAIVIAGNAPGSFEAFVAADLLSLSRPNPLRIKLLREILHELRNAYHEKLNILRQVRQQRINRVLAEITRNAYASLFKSLESIDVVCSAAKELYGSKLDFRSVFYAMKFDKDMVLRVRCSYPPEERLDSLAWNMEEDGLIARCARGGAQWAGLRGAPWPEKDFSWIPRDAQPATVAMPLQNIDGLSIGVLCILYESGFFPDQEEFKRLNEFADQLSAALQQGQRAALLQAALDHIPEPIVLVNEEGCKQYANVPAEELLGIPRGWGALPTPISPSPLDTFLPTMKESMREQQRLVQFIDRLQDKAYRALVLADALTERDATTGHDRTVGGLLHIQDENYYRQIIESYTSLEQSLTEDEALHRLLVIFNEMGHPWIRKYRVERENLVLDTWIERGVELPVPNVSFARNGPFGITWSCIDELKPFVFCFDRQRQTGKTFYTKRGLLVLAVAEAPAGDTLRRESGDYWLDFPLMRSNQKVFGKISIPCDDKLSPERFEMFCTLSKMAGDSFKRLSERQRVSSRELDLWADGFARALKIRVKEALQQLDIVKAMYEILEMNKTLPEDSLSKINREFGKTLKKAREAIDAASSKAFTAGVSE